MTEAISRPRAIASGDLLRLLAFALTIVAFRYIEERQWSFGYLPVWIANPLTLAALLRAPTRSWPLLVATSMAAGVGAMLLIGGVAPSTFLVIGPAYLAEVVLCAIVIRRLIGPKFDILSVRHILIFAGVTTVIVSISMALMPFLMGWQGIINHVFFTLGSVFSYWAAVPCAIILLNRGQWTQRRLTGIDLLLVGFLVAAGGVALGQSQYPLIFLASAPLLLITLRHGLLGSVLGVIVIGVLAICLEVSGVGPFAPLDDSVERVALQVFLVSTLLGSLPLAALLERKNRLEASLTDARDAAEVAAVAKAEFLATMSHELRTPLTSVIGFAGLLSAEGGLKAKQRRHVDRINLAAKSLLGTINDILDYSKLDAGEVQFVYEACDPVAIAHETLDLFTPQAVARGVGLELVAAENLPRSILLDPTRMRQVLFNLIGNAAKFTERGSITLRLDFDEERQSLGVSVIDTGPGIPADQIGRLFQRFSQVEGGAQRKHGGTGLGLAICKALVQGMGGEIGVESEPGHGSRFYLHLPVKLAAVSEADGDGEGSSTTDHLPGKRVLVVDDNPNNQELVGAILGVLGVVTEVASNGEAAIEICRLNPPDAVLMDLRMTGMDGDEAARRIRGLGGRAARLPIIAFSGDALDHALGSAFSGALRKPFTAESLIGTVADQIAAGRTQERARAVAVS